MNKIENALIWFFQVAIVATIIGIVALVGVNAFIKEDIARVEKLKQHLYDVAFSRATVGPSAPTGLKPNYGDLSTPKTRVFADTSVKAKGGK